MTAEDRPRKAPNGPVSRRLTPRQESAALALAAGHSLAEAAEISGAGQRTIKRWRTQPAFASRVTEIHQEMTAAAAGRLADAMTDAAATLRQLLTAQSEAVKLGAARAILELGAKLRVSSGDGTEDGTASSDAVANPHGHIMVDPADLPLAVRAKYLAQLRGEAPPEQTPTPVDQLIGNMQAAGCTEDQINQTLRNLIDDERTV